MSEIKVNKISPRTACGTTTLGDSGDTFTIPSGVTITNNGTQTGFGRTGTVDWQTGSIKTTTFTAVNGEGYFCNTSGGAFTVNLPAGSAGAIVSVSDYTRTFQTNNLTVSPNGSEKIGGVAANATLETDGQSATFVYVDSTEGWINVQETSNSVQGQTFITATGGCISTSGNCKIHKFTGPGTFCVSAIASCSANNEVSYLVVGGGGGGREGIDGSGGGGAGGFREVKTPITPYTASPLCGYGCSGNIITVTATGFPITVGSGGSGGQSPGSAGSVSTFSTISSAGGGGGGAFQAAGIAGASGGGGGGRCGNVGGAGNTPPVNPPQGNAGGTAKPQSSPSSDSGGGGGGATTVGGNGANDPGPAGAGGTGATTSISASPTVYAGGGGGARELAGCGGAGGSGGGGAGGTGGGTESGGSGTANTGGGGGGGRCCSGAGGSGIVIIRYKFQ